MAVAAYAARFSHVPRALEALSHHPGGLPIGTLAAQLGVPAAGLREELLSFFAADAVGGAGQLKRDVSLEFTTADGDDDVDPADADVVRLLTSRPLDELGLAWVPAAEVGRLLTVALALAATEPDDAALAGAIDRLAEVALLGAEHAPPSGGETAALLRTAVQEQRRVRLVYARSWLPGVVERVVEPYRVVSTGRGFECDAGPVRDDGSIRTYLVSGIASCELLEETFERPDDLADVLARTRVPSRVHVVLPHDAAWVAETLAERVAVVASDSDDLELALDVLPPVRERVGQLLVLAGPDAFVVEPAELADAGAGTAAALLAHHQLLDGASGTGPAGAVS